MAGASTDPVVVMAHHPQRLSDAEDRSLHAHSRLERALDEVFARRPAIVAYTAGHTHRHRVQRAGGGVPSIEVGCVKDFPGSWAEYQVYDGGILQIAHRISSPEALAWSEQCRVLYADFGIDYTTLRPRPPRRPLPADPVPLTPRSARVAGDGPLHVGASWASATL